MFANIFVAVFVLSLAIGIYAMVKEEITSHTLQKVMKTYFARAKRKIAFTKKQG